MKVLVTGADGMLGSNLVRLLIAKGYRVHVLVHPQSRSTTLDGLNIHRHVGNILQPESLSPVVAQVDAVIHAAANTSVWPTRSEQVRRINIQGTKNLIELVLKHKVKRMIYIGSAGSVAANGNASQAHLLPGNSFGLDYLDSKFEALKLVLKAVKTENLPALAILPTFMLGPYDTAPSSGKMIIAVATGKLRFYSGGGRNFVYVKDVATAIVNGLTMGTIGKFYIAGNENLSYKAAFKKIATVVGCPEPRIQVPDWTIKTIGFLGSKLGWVLNKPPLISYPIACLSCENQFVNSEAAITDLQMPQTPVEHAIQKSYEWFKLHAYC